MSSRRRLATTAALAAFCGVLFPTCADFSRGSPSPATDGGSDAVGPSGDGDDGAPSFATSIHSLLVTGCQSCHVDGEEAGDSRLLFTGDVAADYLAVSLFVDTSAPAGSRLLSKMAGSGHGGGAIHLPDSPPYQSVLQWIQQGARP